MAEEENEKEKEKKGENQRTQRTNKKERWKHRIMNTMTGTYSHKEKALTNWSQKEGRQFGPKLKCDTENNWDRGTTKHKHRHIKLSSLWL